MSKNRFAQPLYGRIIYIYETNLKMDELATVFNPDTYWIDVTNIECEVGYLVKFVEGEGLKLIPPPVTERTFEEEKEVALEKVNKHIEGLITGGFISYAASGEEVRYDSDRDTQITMQGIALNVNTSLFAEKYPNGCPVRGYGRDGDETTNYNNEKKVYMLTPEQVLQWCADLSMHIGECKQKGWYIQAQVNACTTSEELETVLRLNL